MKKSFNYLKGSIFLFAAITVLFSSCEKEIISTESDWPQFKKDNHRSGNTSVQLSVSTLGEDWVYKANEAPVPAWYGPAKEDTYANSGPLPSMRDYDLAYYPIIIGERLYYGSTSDDAIHCIDVTTGKELWTYTTGGPIRVAPTFNSGKLYFGSDDGYAYCIKATNGKLVWKFSPTEDKYKKVLNNNSLISFWPVRTGVLVEGGIAYFGASLLPWKESYFCAVDIRTGKVEKAGTYINKYDDLTLEGSMASTGTKLIQPQGRISPIFINKKDGVSKGQLAGTGGCFVLITPELNIVHPQTSREKSIMETFGDENTRISDGAEKQAQFMSFKGGKEMVVKDSMSYILTDNSISAYNRNTKKVVWSKRNYKAHRIIIAGDVLYVGGTDKLYAVSTKNGYPLWETPVKGTVYALAVANNALYASTGDGHIYRFVGSKMDNSLYAQNKDKEAIIDKIESENSEVEEGSLEFEVGPFINALGPNSIEVHFISKKPGRFTLNWGNDYDQQSIKEQEATKEHRIVINNVRKDFSYRYQIFSDDDKTQQFDYDNFFNYTAPEKDYSLRDDASNLLKEIKKANNSKNGIAVVFGTENQDVALEIANNSPLKVLIFETSDSKIEKYREQLQSLGVYGSNIAIYQTKSYADLPITSDFANIVVVNNADEVSIDEAIRLVKPNGFAVLDQDGNDFDAWKKDSKNLWQTSPSANHNVALLKKAPYENSGAWTHQYGLPNNSSFGGESLWGSTSTEDFEIQWMGRPGPRFQTDRSGRKPSPLAVNGKMFVQGKERIIAVDAYNGSVYWSKEIPGLSRMNIIRDCSNWVADDNFLYIAHKSNLLKIDNTNGKINNIMPANEGFDWGYISLLNNKIIGSTIPRGSNYTNYYGGAGWYDAQSGPLTHQVVSSSIFGREKDKTENIWEYRNPKSHIINATITITDGSIVFVESRNPRFKLSEEGRGNEEIYKNLYLMSLNPNTGETNWEQPINNVAGIAAYFMAGSQGRIVTVASNSGKYYIYNYSSKTGELIWENELKWYSDNHGAHFSRPAIVNNRLIVKPGMFKLDTGELMKEEVPKAGHGCASYALTEQSAFYRGGSVTQYNFDTNKFSKWERLRPDCWLSTIPAQGMVLSPEAGGGCSCGNWLETSMVFSPKSRAPITFLYSDNKFIDTVSIEIKARDAANESIYFTLDGSTPTKASTKYNEAISFDKNTTLKAVIYVDKNGEEVSFIRTKEFERVRPEPEIVEIPNLTDGNWEFTLNLKSNSGKIHYTVDNSIPSIESPLYTEPVVFVQGTIIKAKTFWKDTHGNFESEETSFEMNVPDLKSSVKADVEPGIVRKYYKEDRKKDNNPDLSLLTPKNRVVATVISLDDFKNKTWFGLMYQGFLDIPVDGVYKISSEFGGGTCAIYLHGKEELKGRGGNEVSTHLFLKKGLHPLRVDYLIGNGNDYYDLQIEGPGMEKQTIPSTLLFN